MHEFTTHLTGMLFLSPCCVMFYSGLYERIEWLNGVSCSCSENGFAEEYGYLVSPCCVMFYTMMMFHGVVIPHFQQRSSLILCVVEFIYSGTKKVSSCLHTPFDTLQDVPNICWC